jgi:hypothetical protein
MSTGPTIPHPIIDCIAHARAPDVREFCRVAEHIRTDLGARGIASRDSPTFTQAAVRLLSFRAAHAALTGCD